MTGLTLTRDPADEASRIIADRYRVDGAIARGGMAEVFAVTDLQEQRKLALKYLRPEASADPRIATLFRLEFYTLRRISHPNIIEVFDFGVDDGHAFYTMELLDGADLSKLAPVEPMRACALLRDVATSLSLLHTQRFLHRDISPRNVRLTQAGRCKLIDFGAMARFGSANDLVGTPPLVAPECLQGGSLDQRTDLFALGGLAYHLLTGKHAYPARTFRDLPECWKRKIAPPSSYAPSVPNALDELVMSLLKLEPAARPTNAALVIDRLGSIAGLTPEPERGTRESYLESSMLAGRERALAKLRAGLQAALGGHGSAVMIESNPGVGKSRLLQEVASEAQLAGMIVAQVDARATQGTYGVVRALYTALSRSAPADVEQAFAAHAPMLGHVLPELQAQLAKLPVDIAERRSAIQLALLTAFAALDEQRPLGLFIDDIEHADDASLLFLKSLARSAKEAPLFLVTSQTLASTLTGKATLASFNRSLSHMRLHRLRRTGTAELVRSIFGDVPNVERWAIYLHEATAGDPSQLWQLMRHMVDSGHIAYVGGTWSLPMTMPESAVPDAMVHALRTRSMRLGPGARTLAELIALYEGSITLEVLVVASELSDEEVVSALDELLFAGICVVSGAEYRLSQPAFRHALRTELALVRAQQLHLRLASALEPYSRTSADLEIKIGHHLIHGGRELDGARRLDSAASRLQFEGVNVVPAARAVEAALAVYQRHQRPWAECIRLRIKLLLWAPYTDPSLVDRYADATVAELYDHCGLATAERLRWLGRGPALVLGIAWSLLRNAVANPSRRGLGTITAITDFVRVMVPAIAVRTGSLDSRGVHRLDRYIAPLAGFGKRHLVYAAYLYCLGQAQHVRGHVEAAKATFLQLLAMLEPPGQLQGATADDIIALRFAGRVGLCTAGIRQGDPMLPAIIDRMAENGGALENAMQRMLRAMYLMVRGEWEAAQEALREFERHSAEVGDIWQLEDTIVPFGVLTASAAGDTVALKRAMTQLRAISKNVASMVLIERLARSLYLAHHGRATEVVTELEEVARRTPPLSEMLWMDIHTDLAFAYLSVGKLERAAAVCRETLASARGEMRFTDIGIAFAHWVWSEAELGLGRPAEALKILDALFVEIEPTGAPLLLGRSHGLRALAKRALGDLEGCSRDLAQMRMYCARSGHPALIASSERFGANPSEALLQRHSSSPPRSAELPQTMKR